MQSPQKNSALGFGQSAAPIQFEFRKSITTWDFSPMGGIPFRIELGITPELLKRKFYFGLHCLGTSGRLNGGTAVTWDRLSWMHSTFQWMDGGTEVALEPFEWINTFSGYSLWGNPCELPLQTEWKETTLTGNVNNLAPDAWITTNNQAQIGNLNPHRTMILPQYRKAKASSVIWSGTAGTNPIADTAALNKTYLFLGVYSERE